MMKPSSKLRTSIVITCLLVGCASTGPARRPSSEQPSVFDAKGMRKAVGPRETGGEWYAPPLPPESVEFEGRRVTLRMQAIQATLLPTGKVLMVSGSSSRTGKVRTHVYQDVDNTALFDPAQVDASNTNHGFEKVPSTATPFVDDNAKKANIDLFCGGQTHLADGTVFFMGGTRSYPLGEEYADGAFFGSQQAMLFDPWKERWIDIVPKPKEGRWYPTLITLGDGRVAIFGGYNQKGALSTVVDVYDPATRKFTALDFAETPNNPYEFFDGGLDLYPRVFLLSDGRLYFTGDGSGGGNRSEKKHKTLFAKLDFKPGKEGAISFEGGPRRSDQSKFYPTSLYEPGKEDSILVIGGGIGDGFQLESFPTETKNNTDPKKRSTEVMTQFLPLEKKIGAHLPKFLGDGRERGAGSNDGRVNHNAVILPTGEFLVIGGGNHGYQDPIFHPVLYTPIAQGQPADPLSGAYKRTLLNPHKRPRLYHGAALLLPDGRIWVGGGNTASADLQGFTPDGVPVLNQENEYNEGISKDQPAEEHQVELFSPPYLFIDQGRDRPVITQAPARVGYGKKFAIAVEKATAGGKVSLIRLGAMTHGMDFSQKFHALASRETASGQLELTAPSNPNSAPPGFYMLFYVNAKGAPSVAKMVQLAHE